MFHTKKVGLSSKSSFSAGHRAYKAGAADMYGPTKHPWGTPHTPHQHPAPAHAHPASGVHGEDFPHQLPRREASLEPLEVCPIIKKERQREKSQKVLKRKEVKKAKETCTIRNGWTKRRFGETKGKKKKRQDESEDGGSPQNVPDN